MEPEAAAAGASSTGVEDEGAHIGTYAQDFQRETGLGDGKSINVIDAIGVAMGAIKELSAKVDKLDRNRAPRERGILKAA
ncbi:hypothetical protein C5688_08655 [Methylocystis sp. MitZ-2018]|nr:hypothetical protein C5688_08655 [Methylocystis sp. MitZ-2018]